MLPMSDTLLNPQQQEAVTHQEGPLLIIAGAGTGKTTVITERIKHLIIDKHIPSHKILALTFTEKSAQEMQERIDIALPYGFNEVWIETFHAFCDKILRQDAIHIGLNPDYKLTTEAENVLFLKKNLFKLHLDYFRPLGNPSKFLQGLLQHFSRLKDEDITPAQYVEYTEKISSTSRSGVAAVEEISTRGAHSPRSKTSASMLRGKPMTGPQDDEPNPGILQEEIKKTLELANAYKTYEELKIAEGIMDFSDLIAYTLKLFRERKNILKKYQEMFEYILIDEFQDTNFAQNQLAILLSGKKQNITVVGDDDQAIYRWRGAALSNMIQFRTNFPTTKVVTLTKNYRSSQLILDTAYQLIQHNNPDRLEVTEGIDKKLTASTKKTNSPVELILADTGENEAEQVAKKIDEIIQTSFKKQNPYSYRDFAVLVRANDHAQQFMKAFDRQHIPYQFLGPSHLFHQEEIKDIIAYLKILTNPEDTASFYRILTMSIFAIHPVTISMILNTAKRRNLSVFQMLLELDSIPLQQQEKDKLTSLLSLIQKHIALASKESVAQIVFNFLQDSGIFQKLIEPADVTTQIQAQNISKFFEKIKSFESENNTASVYDIIEWIDLLMQMGESPQAAMIDSMEADAVNILTVHASKGLEFPIVFAVNLVKERFPSRQRNEQIPIPPELIKEVLPTGDYHMEEERRLFYVAITRAKEKLFFASANFYGEGKREKKLSPFIAESVGENLIEKVKQEKNKSVSQLSLLDFLPLDKPKIIMPITSASSQKTKVTYLSYSQIQTFETCPLHYKLRYLLKIPTPQTTAQTFGTSIHAALRDFYQRRTAEAQVHVSDIAKILKRVWIAEGYQSKEHETIAFERAVSLLEDYLTTELATNPHPIALELPFEFFVNRLRVGGRIDRIDELPDGSIEIIDYKTGANVPTEKEVAKNLQLTTYALAAASIHDKVFQRNPDQILLSLYYIEQGKKLTTTRTPEQLEAAKEELLHAASIIEQSDFICSKSIFCQNCEYKMLCNIH